MGDRTLKMIADILRRSLDPGAILARLYGATFVVLHKGKNAEDILGYDQGSR